MNIYEIIELICVGLIDAPNVDCVVTHPPIVGEQSITVLDKDGNKFSIEVKAI